MELGETMCENSVFGMNAWNVNYQLFITSETCLFVKPFVKPFVMRFCLCVFLENSPREKFLS